MEKDVLIIGAVGLIIGLAIAYFFLWGEPYSELNNKYNELNEDYVQLNSSYTKLQQDHTKLQNECTEVLKEYKACVGREGFFTWINRFLSLRSLAILVGLI